MIRTAFFERTLLATLLGFAAPTAFAQAAAPDASPASAASALAPALASFTAIGDTGYILRYTAQRDFCSFELFRVVPGAEPVRERLTREPNRSCLFQ